jgi:protein-S-isoprenylcysteine O-methyltransferase Ste14
LKIRQIIFRLRVVLLLLIVVLGFYAPWAAALGWKDRFSAMAWLAERLSQNTGMDFSDAAKIMVALAILFAFNGAFWRVWGTAWLGVSTVYDGAMRGAALQLGGPYRFVRNPLYLGSLSTFISLCLLMPPSGAAFALVLITLVYLVLIFSEEDFLAARLGQSFADYRRAVPRLIPRPWKFLPASAGNPAPSAAEWLLSAAGEIFAIGVFLSFASFAWRFDRMLMVKAILVSFGLSLVTRALVPARAGQQ